MRTGITSQRSAFLNRLIHYGLLDINSKHCTLHFSSMKWKTYMAKHLYPVKLFLSSPNTSPISHRPSNNLYSRIQHRPLGVQQQPPNCHPLECHLLPYHPMTPVDRNQSFECWISPWKNLDPLLSTCHWISLTPDRSTSVTPFHPMIVKRKPTLSLWILVFSCQPVRRTQTQWIFKTPYIIFYDRSLLSHEKWSKASSSP